MAPVVSTIEDQGPQDLKRKRADEGAGALEGAPALKGRPANHNTVGVDGEEWRKNLR